MLTTGGRALLLEFAETPDGFFAERGRILGDAGLACPFDTWQSPVESCDQLTKFTCDIVRRYRHGRTAGQASRRETFQISPQFSHRQ
jgi:hypothetical protein